MWTTISNQNIKPFLNKYSILKSFENQEYILYQSENKIFFPRNFISQFPDDNLELTIDQNFSTKNIDFKFQNELRKNQKELVNNIYNLYQTKNQIAGIIKAQPGFGKTIISVYLSFLLKKKTLIIVDNNKIKEQWLNSFLKFTNLSESDIGLIQGKKNELQKPIVIAMVQTLISKIKNNFKNNYNEFKNAGFGLVFYDECHVTSSAPKFALTSLLINTTNIIGLSATPFHQNLHKILMSGVIGEIIYSVKNYEGLLPKIFFVKYKSDLDYKKLYRIRFIHDYVKKIACYNSMIYKDTKYLNLIYKLTKKTNAAKHKTIIVASTVKQVESIVKYLNTNNLSSVPFYSKQKTFDKNTTDILVATYAYVGKGFDWDQLSCLIIACPLKGKISLIQLTGRILRQTINKKLPVVFDLIDMNMFENSINIKKQIFKTEYRFCQMEEIDV